MLDSKYSSDELLKFAFENGMLDISSIKAEIDMKNRREYLSMHKYDVWQGKNGLWYTYLPDEEKGRVLKKRTTREAVEDIVVSFYKSADTEPTLENVFDEWTNEKLLYGEIQRQTYDRYKTDFSRFFDGKDIQKKKMHLISELDIEAFIKTTIRDKELSNKAYSGLRTIINGMFKYAKKKKYTNISITSFMGDMELSRNTFRKRVVDDSKSVFTDNEVEMVFNFINSDKTLINLGIMLAFQTGLRAGELSALTFSDVKGNLLTVNKTEVRYRGDDGKYVFEVRNSAKTDAGNRNVILSKAALKTINQIRIKNPSGKYMFEKNGLRIKEKAFTVKLTKICMYLSITPRSLHKARKTYATKLLNSNVDEKIIINQLGHTDISCTKGFYYFNNKSMEEMETQINMAANY